MARIPDDQLDRLKTEIAVERLAEGMGVVLKRQGKDLLGLCPFHDDHEPSLVISPEQNLWHCLGACQAGGSVIDWVMRSEGVSFRHAAELLLADYQPSLAATAQGTAARSKLAAHSTVKKLPTALAADAGDAKLLAQVIDYYHETLKQSPEALAYLEKRGIANAEAIDRFKLGFANRTLGYRLPMKNRKDGAALRGQLQRIGVLRSSGHEHFNGSLVMPVLDDVGNVVEVYGRKINDRLRKGTPMHLYLPGAHAGMWNAAALKASPEVILCESLIDALTFWCAGFRNVTASYGIEGFTADHLAALKMHNTRRVLIAYDRDPAGEAAAVKLAKTLIAEGLDCYRIHFPKGMDANAYACQVQPATKSLSVVIRSAIWLGKGKAKPVTSEALTSEALTSEVITTDDPITPLVAESVPDTPEEISLAMNDEEPVLPATVIPAVPQAPIEATVSDTDIVIVLGDRRYRIRGLEKNLSFDVMKVNLLVSGTALGEAAVHVDTLDLYQSRPRAAFVKQAAVELGVTETVIKADLGKLLLKCEALQEERIRALHAPADKTVILSEVESAAALDLLQSPDLLDRIASDLTRCGLVGEDANKQIAYLAALSRKLDAPLAVTIQSTSAAGKSALMDAVLGFVPAEDRTQYSAMTGQSLFYMGETDLKHKVLALAEEEGASSASYALKLLQSEGELTIASTGKDAVTGKLETHEYHVEGPVMLMLTTTAIDLDEELLNRCIVLSVDEGRQQTEAIHEIQRQRRTLAGLFAREDRASIRSLHQNAQRLIQSLAIVNPYAKHLTFVADRTRTRRDHDKYLTLIDAIALLHQHQRVIKSVEHNDQCIRYVEVTLDDIAAANRLAHEVLGRTLDELPPQTRKLLQHIVSWVAERCAVLAMNRSDFRFSRRDVREAIGWGNTQLKVHLRRLEELEYLLVHRGGRGQSFVYELLYDGDAEIDAPHLSGLIDVAELEQTYDKKKSGAATRRSGAGRPQVGVVSGEGRHGQNGAKANGRKGHAVIDPDDVPERTVPANKPRSSYRSDTGPTASLVAKAAD